ncbi:hypothetical protein MPLA_760027 [Mesorhizobium sp. ORS 3359]|nr:hypothetical protein MPLA_760027 [Mesorhizobium sp. ORS 3359]
MPHENFAAKWSRVLSQKMRRNYRHPLTANLDVGFLNMSFGGVTARLPPFKRSGDRGTK